MLTREQTLVNYTHTHTHTQVWKEVEHILKEIQEDNLIGQVEEVFRLRKYLEGTNRPTGIRFKITSECSLPLSLKRKVYNQCILPVLTYGSESWRLTKELERKLRSAQRGRERRMLGITWRDKKRASWIREQTKAEDI